jgi:hypothetical protein
MRPRSRSISTESDFYGPETAAGIAESDLRDAAARRAASDSLEFETRAAELADRERAVAAREQLIRALENRLEESRRRLEERLQQVRVQQTIVGSPQFHVSSVEGGYFDAGSYVAEDEWWSRQLGKPPRLAA